MTDAALAPRRGSVLHLHISTPAGQIGGADLYLLELAVAQLRAGPLRPVVLTSVARGFAERLRQHDIPTLYVENFLTRPRQSAAEFVRALQTFDVRLVHSHGYDADYLAWAMKYLPGRHQRPLPTVMTVHGFIAVTPSQKLRTLLNYACYTGADAIGTSSRRQREDLQRFYPRTLIRSIPSGIELPEERPEGADGAGLRRRLQLPENAILIAAVGRLAREKRFDVYLRACRLIAEAEPRARFLLAGSGPEEATLRALARRLGLTERLRFLGLVNDMDPIYRGIDLLISTSDTEGIPRVLLEAMAYRLPVVATGVGGVPELIDQGQNGFFVAARDFHAVAGATRVLLESADRRRRLGRNGRATVAAHFTPELLSRRTEAVYAAVLQRQALRNTARPRGHPDR